MMRLRKNAITIKRALLIFAIIMLVVTCIAGCGAGAGVSTGDKTEGAAENTFRKQMADAGVTEIHVKKNLVLEAPIEVSGTKVLYGEGSITAVGDAWAGDDYMIVVQSGAQLTVKGSVTINAGGVAGGVRAAQGAAWSIEDNASVMNASAMAANTLVEGTFQMNGGTMAGALGHNVYNKGEVTVSEGEIIGSGTQYAGIYGEGKLTQNGGTIRDAYNNVVVLSGGSFQFNGGNNQDSIHDGIYVAEGAKLAVTAKSAVITGSGVRGIYLCGEATVDGITLNSSGDSLVKISQTGTLNLNGGTLADSGYHGVENAGKMVMTGGSVRNSYNCGIVNSGTLEMTGGSILDNANNKGVLNKHDGKATISSQSVMFSGNRFALANEDTATMDLSKAEILLTTTTNVYAFDGQVNIHDINLGAAGSNNVRIYKAEVTMNNVQVLGNSSTGSATTHGILLEGGVLNAKDVTVKNTTGYGIRNKGGHVTAENLLISKSLKAGGISSLLQDHTGAPGVMDIKNLTIEDIRYNNIVVEGGTVTVTDGHLAASGTNNVKTTAGVLNLNNVDVLGNLTDTDGTNHAVYMTGGKIVAENVNIRNARVSGLRINGETAVFTGNKVTIRNSGKYGIDQTIGKISVNNMTLTGNYYNVNNTKGYIGLSNSTLGPTVSNNLRSHGGTLELYNVAVNGHTENHVDNVHALFLSGGVLTGQNITVKDVSNAGLRVSDGTVNIQGLTVNDAGADGVWISKGEATISDLVIKKAGAAGVAATGTSSIAVIGGSINNTGSHGAKSENDAKLTLEDISVAMPTTNGRHAVLAQGGDVHLEDVKITGIAANTNGAGIRINKDTSHVTGKGVSIADVNTGISANAGTSDIYGVTTKGITGHSVYVSETAKLVISDSQFGVTGTNNAKAESKGTLTLNNVVIDGTKTNHGIIVENGGYVYGKNITVRNTAGCAVRVKTGSAGNNVEIDGLITENVGAQNIWVNKDADAGNVGGVVIKNGDLCSTGTHNVRAEAGNLTLIDTEIQGHTSGTANNIHAVYVSGNVEKINLDGVTVLSAAGDALRIASGTVVANDFTSTQTGRNGVWINSGSLTAQNMTVSGSKEIGVQVTGGTAVLNGANISGSANNVLVTGVEMTINGYADGSKSQIGTSTGDNIRAESTGVIRLNDVNVLASGANNVVAINGGTIHMKDSSVTGGNHSVLADNTGTVYLNNVQIKDSRTSGIRANHSGSYVEATGVTIDGAKTGMSIKCGTIQITDITIRNTTEVGVSVAQSTSDANVTLNNLVTENCGTYAIYTSGAAAKLTVNGATLSNDGSDHVVNLNGGPMVLNDVTINGANLASGKYELYSGAGWLTIGGAMDANVYIATNPGRVIKVNKELTGNDLVVDWTNAPTGNALEFTTEAMMNASKDSIMLGEVQTNAGCMLHYTMNGEKAVGILVDNVITSEAELNTYLDLTESQGKTDVTVKIGGSFTVANQVTIPARITNLTIQDDGNTTTTNVVTYNGSEKEIFVWNDCETLTLNGVTINGNKKGNVNVPANTRLNMTDVTVKMPGDRGVQFSGEVHLSGTVTIDNTAGNSSVWGISGATGGVLTSDAGTVVNIQNVQYGFVANGGAKLTTDTLNVTNTANNAIYVDGSGSEMKVTKAVIDGTTNKAVYAKNGTLTIDDLSVSNCGSNSIHVNGGSVTVNKAELGSIDKDVNNILVSSGSLTLKNATVGKNGQNNNICINGGAVNLYNVEVLGNDMTGGDGKHLLYANGTSKIISTGYLKLSDGSAAGIRMDGSAELTAETVEIYGTDLYGIRNTGSSSFEAKNLTVGASATNDAPGIGIQSQAANTVIKITESATLSAKNYNVVGDNGTIEITGATINKTTSNNVATSAASIKLTNSTVLGNSASGNVHAVFGKGGDIVLDNVTISGAATAGIRINNANSTVTATNVTISDCAYAVTMNAGELILNNATITAATGKGIVVDGGKQSVSGKIVADIRYNVATALNVTGALTYGSNVTVDWAEGKAPADLVVVNFADGTMEASKSYITLGDIQSANYLLHFNGTAGVLTPCTAVTGWSDLSEKVSAQASGSNTTYRITGDASNWTASAPMAIPEGAQVVLLADENSPTVVVGSGVSPFTLNANSRLTLENVVVGGTADAKAAHIIVPASATLTLKNATLQYFASSYGGAVHVNKGTLIATGSTFANNSNTTNWGGAIGIWGGTVNISDSTFTGNTSKNSGGAIINYKADGASLGGSTDGTAGTLTLTNCTFTGNSTSEHGGAVASWAGGTTTITGCTFESNSVTKNGGAIHVSDSHKATVTSCKFTSNSASSDGGAIYHKSSVQMTVTNSTFTGNKGTEGGAISTTANLKVSGTKFISNQATTGRAGAVMIWNTPTVEFNDCEFSGNTAESNGGAVGKGGNSGGVLNITACKFDGNSAPNGEGGALMLQSSPTVTITGSTFTGNSAKTNGGVIKNNSSTTGMTIQSCEFSNNSAGGSGGVLYQQDGKAANLSNCTFAGNTAAAGNAVYSVGGTVTLTGGNIQEADCSGKYTIVKE